MKLTKLYGCLNIETGELQGCYTTRGTKYAYCRIGKVKNNFDHLLKASTKYKIVELLPHIMDEKCQEQ